MYPPCQPWAWTYSNPGRRSSAAILKLERSHTVSCSATLNRDAWLSASYDRVAWLVRLVHWEYTVRRTPPTPCIVDASNRRSLKKNNKINTVAAAKDISISLGDTGITVTNTNTRSANGASTIYLPSTTLRQHLCE